MNENSLSIIKIGGNVIDNDTDLELFLNDFAKVKHPKILIHGGGKLATKFAEKLNIPINMIEGRRVTDAETLQLVTMVYAGWINKSITAKLCALNCKSLGLSGADSNIITATKRSAKPIDYGYVGDISVNNIDSAYINSILLSGVVPVFCSITSDKDGNLLNCNADTIATGIAISMSKTMFVKLIFCFEKNGVLMNPDDNSSLIPSITKTEYAKLKANNVITKGMIPKLDNAFNAIEQGVKEVHIKHAKNINNTLGTIIK